MRSIFFFLYIFLCILLSGCTKYTKAIPTPTPTKEITSFTNTNTGAKLKKEYKIYQTQIVTPQALEMENTYIGAHILSDDTINYNIKNFEEKINFPHSHYLYNYKLDNQLKDQWLYDCISLGKTPYIVVKPKDEDYYNLEYIKTFAKNINRYNSYFFIELYPLEKSKNYDINKYKEFFNSASNILKENSKICIVYNNYDMSVVETLRYEPEETSYDWVGYSYFGIMKNHSYPDFYTNLNFIYDNYSAKKPIFIANLAISHYSEKTGSYYTMEAIKKIEEIYNTINEKYPRIKGINYININGIKKSNNFNNDNFLITDTREIYEKYGNILKENNFLSKINENSKLEINENILLDFSAYKYNNEIYFEEKIIEKFHLENMYFLEKKLDEKILIPLNELENSLNIQIDESKNQIFIKKDIK